MPNKSILKIYANILKESNRPKTEPYILFRWVVWKVIKLLFYENEKKSYSEWIFEWTDDFDNSITQRSAMSFIIRWYVLILDCIFIRTWQILEIKTSRSKFCEPVLAMAFWHYKYFIHMVYFFLFEQHFYHIASKKLKYAENFAIHFPYLKELQPNTTAQNQPDLSTSKL